MDRVRQYEDRYVLQCTPEEFAGSTTQLGQEIPQRSETWKVLERHDDNHTIVVQRFMGSSFASAHDGRR